MDHLSRLSFGRVRFDENEEYLQFRFKFLCVVLLIGALATLVFIVGNRANVNPINVGHVRSMICYSVVSLMFWLCLRGRKQWFLSVAILYELSSLAEFISALYYVSEDELRILWLFVNIPGVYILLGRRSGAAVTLFSIVLLVVGNAYLPAPYSPNALATAVVSMAYLGLFFHFYSQRSISYFLRMRDANRRLAQMASSDALTGVMNAGAYYVACGQLIELARRHGTLYAVLFVDLDHFKAVNDTYGHAVGDALLRGVAKELAAHIRASDVLGRVGGEEFSVFLPDTDENGAWTVAEGLRAAVERMMLGEIPASLRITASVGVAVSSGAVADIGEIQQQADQAMYLAKQAGRNRVSACARV